MALTTIDAFKTHLGMESFDTTLDPQLNQIIAGVDAAIKKQLKQQFESATYTEYYDGSGTESLYLRQTPVSATGPVGDALNKLVAPWTLTLSVIAPLLENPARKLT